MKEFQLSFNMTNMTNKQLADTLRNVAEHLELAGDHNLDNGLVKDWRRETVGKYVVIERGLKTVVGDDIRGYEENKNGA